MESWFLHPAKISRSASSAGCMVRRAAVARSGLAVHIHYCNDLRARGVQERARGNVKARRGGCLPHLAGTQCQAANRAVPPAPAMRRGAARVLSLLLASTLGSPFARRAPLQWCSNAQHQTARGLPPGRAGAPPPQQQQQYHTDRLPWKTLSPLPHHLYPSALDNGADEDRRTAETSSGPLGMRAEFWSEDWQRRPVVRALRRLLLSILTLPVYKPACMPVSSGASYIRTIPARLISSS